MDTNKLMFELSVGELSNLALSNEGSGEIREKDIPKIINYINEGLVTLYSKFKLSENDVLIQLHDHITEYHLIKRFTESAHSEYLHEIPYILDNNREPFLGDVLKILAVYDSYGIERNINDDNAIDSVHIKNTNILMVPNPLSGIILSVQYQAKHQEITKYNLDQEINLHESLVPALKAYVAYKTYSSINTPEMVQKGIEYLNAYTSVCSEHIMIDFTNESSAVYSNNFSRGGWA